MFVFNRCQLANMMELIEVLCNDCNERLSDFSCFTNDTPDVHFRMGIWDGPLILYSRESEKMHNLLLRDLKGNAGVVPIPTDSEGYRKLEVIARKIQELRLDDDYREQLQDVDKRMQMDDRINNLVDQLMQCLRKKPVY